MPSPFNNEDMPFYLLALFLAPATVYFKNGYNFRDVQFWINFVFFFPIVFHSLGHLIAIGHAWYIIYHASSVTGDSSSSYLDRLQYDDDEEESPIVRQDQPSFNDSAPAPSYSDANGKQPLDNKIQV